MSPCRHIHIFIQPLVDILIVLGIDRSLCHEIQLIVLQQRPYGLLRRTQRLLIFIDERVDTYIYYRTLPTLLTIVNPTYHRHHRVHKRVVVHPVLAMKTYCRRVVLTKQVIGVHSGILIAKESPYPCRLFFSHLSETLLCHLLILLHQSLCHHEVLYSVLTRIREMLSTNHTVFLHRVAHLQGWVYEDTVKAVEHLRIHASHRGADDKVGLLLLTDIAQKIHCLLRMDGKIGSYHLCLRQHLTDTCHRAALS